MFKKAFKNNDQLQQKFCKKGLLDAALTMLSAQDQTEEEFLGARAVELLCETLKAESAV